MALVVQLSHRQLWLPVVVGLFPALILLIATLLLTGGQLTYTLDDPYIHLALARNIWQGTYGINLFEPSAPSSSILWPFLLAPFSALKPLFEYVPLLINLLCLTALALVIDRLFADLRAPTRAFLTFTILLSLNAYGLVFTGMEHSLQVLLVGVIFLTLRARRETGAEFAHSRALLAVSLVLLPWTRYEGLAISLPVIGYLFLTGERRFAVLLLACIGIVMAGFSVFLHSKGLGYLPTSVVAKSTQGTLVSIFANGVANLQRYGFVLVPIGFLLVYYWRRDRLWALALAAMTALHFTLGKFGWYGRYEVYFLLFMTLATIRLLATTVPDYLHLVALLPLGFLSLVYATVTTPLAAANILNQQAQMARIAGLLGQPVAVNDLGLVALRSGCYVLDLWGLGSIEALRQRQLHHHDPGWISALMAKKGVEYAIVYDAWFPDRPASWHKIADLRLTQTVITPASDVVSFYATSDTSRRRLTAVLDRFAVENPSDDFRVELAGR